MFSPQPYSRPVVVIPCEKLVPAEMLVQLAPAGPDTNTGDDTVTVDRFPSAPAALYPQAYNCPVVVMPSACSAPDDTVVHDAPAGPDTSTGDETGVTVEKLPTCP